jgi:hypothetical protein
MRNFTTASDVFWTTAFHVGAATVAAIDNQRWPIELFQIPPDLVVKFQAIDIADVIL